MANERIHRRVERLLDRIDTAEESDNWQEVVNLARDVLAVDEENREAVAYLQTAERHLGNSSEVEGDSAVAENIESSVAPSLVESTQPTSFSDGRYQVKRFLGEGGKKMVYLAQDTLLDRDVAFALIKTDGLDDVSRTRISREAQAMGRLGSHPHIVTVFDLGDHEGQPFMVVELLGGGDVEGILEDAEGGRLPLEQAISIAVETCRGLEFAHSRGIVHRDLKPGNVWLTEDGVAKIGDFGLAVSMDRSRLTAEGMMVGTVSYMPPEQAMGGEVTPRADLYSLGAMLYEMVCGRPPFLGDDNIAIIGQHINTPPVAPTWHNSECPPALEILIMRLLDKDASKRPESAGEVLNILESINLEQTPTLVEPSIEAPIQPDGQNPIYRHTFVGREAEVKQLQTAFNSTLSGEGALAVVVGEPGIGKTTITEQLATYVTLRGGKTLVGHCYLEGSLSLPYLPFVEAMRSYVLERDSDDLKRELGSGATDVARIVSEVRDRVDIEPRESGDAEQDRYRLLQAVTDFLRNASSVQPLLIVLEDLHDADRGTLDMLTHVARNQSGARLMIVGTYRDVEVDRSHPLSGTLADLRRLPNFNRVLLRGLSADEVQRMLSAISEQNIPWPLSEAVHRQTEGNPLFVQEVVRYLVEEGLIAREGDRWQSTSDISLTMSIPEGLRDVIGKRLSRLSDECNRVLSVAAVIGREFRMDVLGRVADVSEDELFSTLEEAQGAAVIEERSSAGGVVTFWFTHAFFRQTLYEETFTPRRIRLHRQVGEALEDVHSSRLTEHASEMAEHFSHSSDDAGLAKALKYGEMAAERAMSVYAHGEAVRLFDQAVEIQRVLDPSGEAKLFDLLLELGNVLISARNPRRAGYDIANQALALADSIPDRSRAFAASELGFTALINLNGGFVSGNAEHTNWVRLMGRHAASGSREQVRADIAQAALDNSEDRYAESRALSERAFELANQLKDQATLYRAAWYRFRETHSTKDRQSVLRIAREFSANIPSELPIFTHAQILNSSAWIFMSEGDRATADEMGTQLRILADDTREPAPVAFSNMLSVWFMTVDGQLESAMSQLANNEGILSLPGRVGLFPSGVRLRLSTYLGKTKDELHEILQRPATSDGGHGIRTGAVAALCEAHMGNLVEAAIDVDRLVNELDIEDIEAAPINLLAWYLETAVLIGHKDAASLLSEQFEPIADMVMANLAMTCVARLLGGAATLLGDPKKAREYYILALEVTSNMQFRPEIALTRLQLAELLLENYPDERAQAMEHLDLAIPEFRDMKMQPSLERALSHRDILKA